MRRIAIIQGHPDATGHHLLNAMADAYADGASLAGHQVKRIEVAKLDFPLLRTQVDFETGELPTSLMQARDDMRWAEHWVFLFALARNDAGARSKAFSNICSGPALPVRR